MEFLRFQEHWELLAVVVGVIATVLGIFGTLSKAAQKLIEAWRIRKRRKSIKGLLLVPTVEEAARYSVKIPQKYDADEAAYQRKQKQLAREFNAPSNLEAEGRLAVLALMFCLAFAFVALRFVQIYWF